MLNIKERGLLLTIIKHCTKINEKIDQITLQDFKGNEDIQIIISFHIFQISELARNFEPSFIKKYNGVPWKQIKRMRDKVVHGYDKIDLNRVWNTALNDVPLLLEYCKIIINDCIENDRLIAYCGLDCSQCEARIATLNNDDELRKKVAKEWSVYNKVEITPEMINCLGCRVDGVKFPFCDSMCPIRICGMSKKVNTCGDCEGFEECEKLKMVTGNNKEALERLKK